MVDSMVVLLVGLLVVQMAARMVDYLAEVTAVMRVDH